MDCICLFMLNMLAVTISRVCVEFYGVFIGGFCLDSKLMQLNETNREIINSHTATASTMTMLSKFE